VRIALDTNVLVYAEGVNGAAIQQTALDLIGRLRQRHEIFLPVQVLGELFNVLTRRASRPRDIARTIILSWRDTSSLIDTSAIVMLAATDLAADHRLVIWDAVVLSAAAESGCRLLLSQDLQEGFTWGGVTIINPFSSTRHPLLARLLAGEVQ
jgi:predicted nucleic acid-binding protein